MAETDVRLTMSQLSVISDLVDDAVEASRELGCNDMGERAYRAELYDLHEVILDGMERIMDEAKEAEV